MKEKKRSMFKNLKVQLPLTILTIVTVINLSIVALFYNGISKYSNETATAEIQMISDLNADKVLTYMTTAKTNAEAMSNEITRTLGMTLYTFNPGVSDGSTIRSMMEGYMRDDKIFSTYIAMENSDAHPNGLSFYTYRKDIGSSETVFEIAEDYASYSQGDYYKTTKEVRSVHVTDPYTYTTGNGNSVYLITVATPIWNGDEIIGVATCSFLLDGIQELAYTKGNYTKTSIVGVMTGNLVYVYNSMMPDLVGTVDDQATDEARQCVASGKKFQVVIPGYYVIYSPIVLDGSDLHWATTLVIETNEIMEERDNLVTRSALIAAIFLAALIGVSIFLFMRAFRAIVPIVHYTRELAHGNLHAELEINLDNEFGDIINELKSMSTTWRQYIDEISTSLGAIANKDLTSEIQTEFVGDFAPIKDALENINDSLNDTMVQIAEAGRQVSDGAVQIANGAQNLAQGSTEQASAVEELNATVNDIYSQAEKNTEKSQVVATAVTTAGEAINASNVKMKELTDAMEDMTNKSNEISKIVKTIEDIAFQTNILALNAAVEAARAGTAGKGFAVVADEVRNLATKSSEAASETTKLIGETIAAINNGSKIATETANDLENVVAQTSTAASDVREIASASETQSSAISQVKLGIEQISVVVSTNSATSEESAAASEELSGQANVLQGLLDEFDLKN